MSVRERGKLCKRCPERGNCNQPGVQFHASQLTLGDSLRRVAANPTVLQVTVWFWQFMFRVWISVRRLLCPEGLFAGIHVPVDASCSSLRAHAVFVVPSPRPLLTEMLVGCSPPLSVAERLRWLKSWLPWRHLSTPQLHPPMCHCHHPFAPGVRKKNPNNFISISALTQTVRLNTGTTVRLPELLPKKMCCSTVFMLTQLIQTNAGPEMHLKSDLVNVSLF